ncbi:MAG: RHS repeat domain-containing protein, partial [Planctomycetota bacterium]
LIATENIKGNVSSNPAGYTIVRDYDADDRLTSITYPNGSVVTRAYTARDQLDTVTQDPDGAGPLTATQLADFDYDTAMREELRTLGQRADDLPHLRPVGPPGD